MRINKSIIREELVRHKELIENFSYITILQAFVLLSPVITYPYLIRVLGRDLYGMVLTAQMLSSYASIIIDFGSTSVCAKHVSINRDNPVVLSEILSSVLLTRFALWCICLVVYIAVVFLIPSYREFFLLFLLSYGLTFHDLLFPQFYFQGIEKMKYITLVNVLTKLVFILLVFFVVKGVSDYLLVPVLYSIGYISGGAVSLYIIIRKHYIRLSIPKFKSAMVYVKDSFPIFATNLISTIKDKFNYLLVGIFSGAANVPIYDLALKLHSFLTVPMGIITMVFFPRFAVSRNVIKLKQVIGASFIIALLGVILTNIFLVQIVHFFIGGEIDLLPIRIFLFAPLCISVSSVISSNLFVAFGYNKYVFYSILVTTGVYLAVLIGLFCFGRLNSVYSFVYLSLIAYFAELMYRLIVARRIMHQEITKQNEQND